MSLDQEINELWAALRRDGAMAADAPARKIGMPHATPFSVGFPVEVDGSFVMVDLDFDEVGRFAAALVRRLREAREMGAVFDAEYAASVACQQ